MVHVAVLRTGTNVEVEGASFNFFGLDFELSAFEHLKPLIYKTRGKTSTFFLPFHSEEYHHQPQTVIYRIDTVLVVGSGIF